MSDIFSEVELKKFLTLRRTTDANPKDKILSDKIINKDVLINQFHLEGSRSIHPLLFENCVFNGLVNVHDYISAGRITFKNCTFNNDLAVYLDNTSFSEDCEFFCDVTLQVEKKGTTLTGWNVMGELKLEGETKKLILKQINKKVSYPRQKINISLSPTHLEIWEVNAHTLTFAESFTFTGIQKISHSSIIEILFNSITLNTELEIRSSTISRLILKRLFGVERKLLIDGCNVQQMPLGINELQKITISNSHFHWLKLKDSNSTDSFFTIEKCTVRLLEFNHLYNNGLLTLREIKIPPEGAVIFNSTNLGKADFIYCDFSKGGLEFENSKITEAFFWETEFPQKVVVDRRVNFDQAQLTFGQLATAYQKQGDNVRALEYSSREIAAHYYSINLFSKYFFRKINLWLSMLSNDFGRDWVRGSIFSFCVGILFFCLLLISTKEYHFGTPSWDIKLLPAFLKFLNPFRFFELEALFDNTPRQRNITLNSMSYLADFGGRIFVAYGFYQTIQAFRKFGRK